jgi:hypothetical protein
MQRLSYEEALEDQVVIASALQKYHNEGADGWRPGRMHLSLAASAKATWDTTCGNTISTPFANF